MVENSEGERGRKRRSGSGYCYCGPRLQKKLNCADACDYCNQMWSRSEVIGPTVVVAHKRCLQLSFNFVFE